MARVAFSIALIIAAAGCGNGNGGNGGSGGGGGGGAGGGGGGGGAGGYGAIVTGATANTNSSTITAGAGGIGGAEEPAVDLRATVATAALAFISQALEQRSTIPVQSSEVRAATLAAPAPRARSRAGMAVSASMAPA